MRRLLWPAAAACFLVAGCTASGHEGPAGDELPRPLSGAVHFSAGQADALRRMEEEEIRSCMRERGHVYRTAPVSDPRRLAAENPYGLLDADWAEDDGYGITAEQLAGRPQDPNASYVSSLPKAGHAAWEEALLGEEENHRTLTLPDGAEIGYDPRSCVEVASSTLYGERWTELRYLMESLTNLIATAVRDAPGFRDAELAWADCMAEQGHEYRKLSEPRSETGRRLEKTDRDPVAQRSVGRDELALARDDLACQRDTDLAGAVTEAQVKAEAKSREQWRREIEEYRAMKASALAKADRAAE
ncbi:hypothetical protein OG596_37690 [Streptomyces sp. NBC_01102]|uniref:hypothetical protein n=1 Tax=unclassified Streptomyces TaxID=2593676 RepID=UPI0038699BB1|nr:hypothetical protein OG596_00230 [Streptomyces sp. NBC_01102]WSU70692.1 hypothetical protein OG596_37690 [Streptomyces sp. NBC_01102]